MSELYESDDGVRVYATVPEPGEVMVIEGPEKWLAELGEVGRWLVNDLKADDDES